MPALSLTFQLESELPRQVAVGAGTAVFVAGWCFCPDADVRALSLEVEGRPQPLMAFGMPRLDPLRALGDPRAYRSGFWGLARIAPRPPGHRLELGLVATLAGGGEVRAALATIEVAESPEPIEVAWPARAPGPRVAIAMATYNPPEDLFAAQVASIRAQTHDNWVVIVSDDASSPAGQEVLARVIGDDERFVVSRAPRRLGFYGNFERALSLIPRGARFVALADQDDAWHPDKLARLLEAIGDQALAYSDARVVSRDGRTLSETWWSARRNNHEDLLSLLVANSVTGAASLLRRELLDAALPFPPAQFAHFHDHWLGLVALARGGIAYVDSPLYDYVQHGAASLGHAGANRMTSIGERLRRRRGLRERIRRWRLHYFVDICRLLQFAAVLELRAGEGMAPRHRRALRRFAGADGGLGMVVRMAVRGGRELLGTPETLGAEWMLFHALLWRRLLTLSERTEPGSRLRLDALPPPSLVMAPGRQGLDPAVREVAEKGAPLRWSPADSAPERINLLIPTIDLRHLFGGYIAKFNLALRLAARGERVRIITTDPVGPLPGDWRAAVESYEGLRGLTEQVEIVFGRESSGIEVSRRDRFVATTWWTAHIAHAALRSLRGDEEGHTGEPFLYLIQEYEPFTFPMGTWSALAAESYRLPHVALFSSDLLREYFRAHRLGVYAAGLRAGDRASGSFQNAITAVVSPTHDELSRRPERRLLFYARPEPHAARNLFELGVLALSEATAEGAFAGWELNGIGTVQAARPVELGEGRSLRLLPRSAQADYAETLRGHDVGLALMYTPHPSLVPIEMASAGMVTVTNRFENKTPEAMAAISPNLVAVEPTVSAVAAALRAAEVAAEDHLARVRGSSVAWSTDWTSSLPDALLIRVLAALDPRSG